MSTTFRFSLAQYDEMIRRGVFGARGRERLELIRGEIRAMSPIGPFHEVDVDFLNEWSIKNLPEGQVWVRIQNSIGLPALDSAPEPDIAWVRRRDYSAGRPRPEDVLLIIEVADSSLEYDRGEKADLYAEAGIQESWIVNIPGRCLEVFRDPQGTAYRSQQVLHPGQEARSLAFPESGLPVARLFAE